MEILDAIAKLFRDDKKKLGKDPAKELIRLQYNDMEPATVKQLDPSQHKNPVLGELAPEIMQYIEASGLGRDVRGYNAPAETIMWASDPTEEVGAGDASKQDVYNLAMEVYRAMNDVSGEPIYERVTSGEQPRVSIIDRLTAPERQVDTAAHEMTHAYLQDAPQAKGLSGKENEALTRLFDVFYANSPDTKSASTQYMKELGLSDDERDKVTNIFMGLKQLLEAK